MKVERINLLDTDSDGLRKASCDWCEPIYNEDTEEYEKPNDRYEGYRFGYTTVCKECLESLWEGKTLLDKIKRVKSVEV